MKVLFRLSEIYNRQGLIKLVEPFTEKRVILCYYFSVSGDIFLRIGTNKTQ